MATFPSDLQPADGSQRTELICPDCGGSITVHAVGPQRMLAFRCRVGHSYTLEDLVVGKEAHIETVIWQAIHAYEEFAALLKDLDETSLKSLPEHERSRRMQQAHEQAHALRRIVEHDQPVKLMATDSHRESQ